MVYGWSISGGSYLELQIRDSNCKIRRIQDFSNHTKKEEPKYKQIEKKEIKGRRNRLLRVSVE